MTLAEVAALVEAARHHERLLAQRTLDTHVFQQGGHAARDAAIAEREAAGVDVLNRQAEVTRRVEKAEKDVAEVEMIARNAFEVAASALDMPLLDRDDAKRQAEYLRSMARAFAPKAGT